MVTLKPFRVLRPKPELAAEICTLPYDVMNTEEARAMADGKPLSFLRVTRSEIEFPEGTDPYSDQVYEHGAARLREMEDEGALVRESRSIFMLYRQMMGKHTQTGLVAVASCEEYDNGLVKKHELTRPDKEDDRTRHINILNAQTGPVFLTYEANAELDQLFADETSRTPDIDFTAEDGIRHSAWFVRDEETISKIESGFSHVEALYVADGHHRSAAASRVAKERAGNQGGRDSHNYFLTVSFPHNQMQILAYNRVVKDLNGLTPSELLEKLDQVADVQPLPGPKTPTSKGQVSMYLDGKWHAIQWKPEVAFRGDAVAELDVSILQDQVLTPFLAIGNPRTDKRIQFIGGIRGTQELEKLVNNGSAAVAFAMYPTSIEDLMTIADQGGLMPPKSTWFEPKLRDAMAVHILD